LGDEDRPPKPVGPSGESASSRSPVEPRCRPTRFGSGIEPIVTGLVQGDWREVALREITPWTFVLNLPRAKRAIEAELSICIIGSAWRILWALFGDYGLKPDDIEVGCDSPGRRLCARAMVRLPNQRPLQRHRGSRGRAHVALSEAQPLRSPDSGFVQKPWNAPRPKGRSVKAAAHSSPCRSPEAFPWCSPSASRMSLSRWTYALLSSRSISTAETSCEGRASEMSSRETNAAMFIRYLPKRVEAPHGRRFTVVPTFAWEKKFRMPPSS
jgi:hypothetical protein